MSLTKEIFKKYPDVHSCFEDIVAGAVTLESLGIEKKLAKELTEIVKQRMKPKEVELKGKFTIKSYLPDGVDIIKKILKSAVDKKEINITYEGAGKYMLKIKSPDYKSGEKLLDKVTEKVLDEAKKKECECDFERAEA